MARQRQPEVPQSDLKGFKYFKMLLPLLERLQSVGTARDKAGNRQLFFDQYAALLLLYFFNPIINSMRALLRSAELEKVQRLLGVRPTSLGSFSEAPEVFAAEHLRRILRETAGKALPLYRGREAEARRDLYAVVARSRGMPIRGITLFLFGGVAEIGEEPPSAGTEFVMAIAGPLVSVVLAIGFWLLAMVGYNGGWPFPIVIVLGYLAAINGMVLAFNLIPAFPLDGGRVLRSIMWGATGNLRRATYWAALAGRAFAWFLIGWGILKFFAGDPLGGIFTSLIGMFLNGASQSGYQQVLVRQALEGEPVRRFMNPDPIVVSPSLDLQRWVEEFVYRYHHRAFPVTSNGRLEGLITTQALSEIPRGEWSSHTVGEVMMNDLEAITIGADADALEALKKMQRTGSSRLLIAKGDHLLGIISLKDLLRFLELKLELEGRNDVSTKDGNSNRDSEREEELVHH